MQRCERTFTATSVPLKASCVREGDTVLQKNWARFNCCCNLTQHHLARRCRAQSHTCTRGNVNTGFVLQSSWRKTKLFWYISKVVKSCLVEFQTSVQSLHVTNLLMNLDLLFKCTSDFRLKSNTNVLTLIFIWTHVWGGVHDRSSLLPHQNSTLIYLNLPMISS